MANTAYDCFLATAAEVEAATELPPLTDRDREVLFCIASFGEQMAARERRLANVALQRLVHLLESK